MAKPRIFISSTFYDLRQVRADIDYFIETMGYEAVRNEEGDIPYGQNEALEQYCYKEVDKADILVSIIGGRYGSESRNNKGSVTQQEIKVALERNKQVYIFIEKNVLTEYSTYLKNKNNKETVYNYVDNPEIYKFIEDIKALRQNNIIKDFETAQDIVGFLKNQLSGLFQRFLESQSREKERNLIKELESTANNLNKLVQYLSDQNKDNAESIDKILMFNHPLVGRLSSILKIKFNFYIEGFEDLNQFLNQFGFYANQTSDNSEYYQWVNHFISDQATEELQIDKSLFDEEKKLRYIAPKDWKDDYVVRNHFSQPSFLTCDTDLPF